MPRVCAGRWCEWLASSPALRTGTLTKCIDLADYPPQFEASLPHLDCPVACMQTFSYGHALNSFTLCFLLCNGSGCNAVRLQSRHAAGVVKSVAGVICLCFGSEPHAIKADNTRLLAGADKPKQSESWAQAAEFPMTTVQAQFEYRHWLGSHRTHLHNRLT